jgi:hypothetical protein
MGYSHGLNNYSDDKALWHYRLMKVYLKHLPAENFWSFSVHVFLQMCVNMADQTQLSGAEGCHVDKNGPFSCSQQGLNNRNFRC